MTKNPIDMTLQRDSHYFYNVPDTTVTNQHLQHNSTQPQLQIQRNEIGETVFTVNSNDLFYAVETPTDQAVGDITYTNCKGVLYEEGCNDCWNFDPTCMKQIYSPDEDNTDDGFQPIRRKYRNRHYRRCLYQKKSPYLIEKRNARERKRVQAVNSAFTRLRRVLPYTQERSKRVSKVRTLQEAIHYINYLQQLLVDDELTPTPSLNFNDVRPRDNSKVSFSKGEQKRKNSLKNYTRYQFTSKLNGKGNKLNSNRKAKLCLNSNHSESNKQSQTFPEAGDINDTFLSLPNAYVPGIENTMGTLPINPEDAVKEEYPLVSNGSCPFDLKVIPVKDLNDVSKPSFWGDGLSDGVQDSSVENYPKRDEELSLWGNKIPQKSQNTPNCKNSEGSDQMLGIQQFPDKVVDSDDILSRVVAASISSFSSFPDK